MRLSVDYAIQHLSHQKYFCGQISNSVLYLILVCLFCVFFFQAEDGIRDADVTGVQTCALPISGSGRRSTTWSPSTSMSIRVRRKHSSASSGRQTTGSFSLNEVLSTIGTPVRARSEERRVGKECRSRWWGEH